MAFCKPSGDEIIDVVHGVIDVPPYARAVLNTALMRRLGRINQLGLLYHKFPSATHTRLEHSIGTMHLAIKYLHILAIDDPEVVRVFALAALLHDVAHGPFSHAFENALLGTESWRIYGGHDEHRISLVMENRELEAVLGADAAGIIAVWTNNPDPPFDLSPELKRQIPVLHALLAGTVGVDRLDYVLRDLYYTAPEASMHPNVIDIIMRETMLDGDGISFTDRGRVCAQLFLKMRTYLHRHVYFHPEAVAADQQLRKAIMSEEELYRFMLLPATFEQLDDGFVVQRAWSGRVNQQLYRDVVNGTYPRYVQCAESVATVTCTCKGVDSLTNIRRLDRMAVADVTVHYKEK
jgi:uncharacterized protein